MFKKADIFLAIILVRICGAGTLLLGLGGERGSQVRIAWEGETYGTYSLFEDREIELRREGRYNKVVISGGSVFMEEANCPGQECVHQGKVSRINQPIVCLPNEVVVTVEGSGAEVDAVL